MEDTSDFLFEYYRASEDNVVELANGDSKFGDIEEFYLVVDYFASQYGLGGCKSLEEFADMIDKTDPVLLRCLQLSSHNRLKKQYGVDDDDDKKEKYNPDHIDEEPEIQHTSPKRNYVKVEPMADGGASKAKMKRFLRTWGVPSSELQSAEAELSKRKIKFKDFSWLTPDELANMSSEKFGELKKQIIDDQKNTVNFEVSIESLIRGQRGEQDSS